MQAVRGGIIKQGAFWVSLKSYNIGNYLTYLNSGRDLREDSEEAAGYMDNVDIEKINSKTLLKWYSNRERSGVALGIAEAERIMGGFDESAWVWMPVPPLTGDMTVSKLLNCSELHL